MKNNKSIHFKKKLLKGNSFFIALFLFIFLTGCQTTKNIPQDFSDNYQEVHKFSYSYYISKIDLNSPGLQIICKIDTDNFFDLPDFAAETGATYAINTTPFSKEKTKSTVLGITKVNNQILTEPVEKYSALCFYFNNKNQIQAKVIENQTDEELKNLPVAFGGYFTILKDNQIITYKNIKRSRSACGIDKTGRYLYLMAVTSNSILGRTGLSYEQCAEILQTLGCTDALEFDGGHSTALISPDSGYVHSKKHWKIPAAFGIYFN